MAFETDRSSAVPHFDADPLPRPNGNALVGNPDLRQVFPEPFYQQPLGVPNFISSELIEKTSHMNIQARLINEDIYREHQLHSIPQSDLYFNRSVEELFEEDRINEEIFLKGYETNGFFSPRSPSSRLPHQRGSSPTSVLDNSRDAWNLLFDATSRMQQIDINKDMQQNPNHEMYNYFSPIHPRNPNFNAFSLFPSSPSNFTRSFVDYMPVEPCPALDNGIPQIYQGAYSDIPQHWHHEGGYGWAKQAPIPIKKPNLMTPVFDQQQYHRNVVYTSNNNSNSNNNSRFHPMRPLYPCGRNMRSRESTGTGVFLPRAVGNEHVNTRKNSSTPIPTHQSTRNEDYNTKKIDNSGSIKSSTNGFNSYHHTSKTIKTGKRSEGSQPRFIRESDNVQKNELECGAKISGEFVEDCSSSRFFSNQSNDGNNQAYESAVGDGEGCDDIELPSEWVY